MTGILIALAAGLASALMFASIVSGADLDRAVLPCAPASDGRGAGLGSATAMIGGIVPAISLGAIFGIPMLAFALTIALPPGGSDT